MTFAPFLRAFSLAVLIAIAAAAAIVASAGPDLPAPHLSRSESFNEKARFLRNALARDPRCEVLAVGSSMTLNGLDAAQFARPGERVINAASFAMTPDETVQLMRIILPLCRPRLVVMASYQGDFAPSLPHDKEIRWEQLNAYIRGGSTLSAHLADLDPRYLIERSLKRDELHRTDIYTALAFDRTGGVALDCEGLHKQDLRWNGDLHDSMPAPRPSSLAAISEMARMARQAGARLVVAVPPLRPRAEAGFHASQRNALWNEVAARIAGNGGILIRPAANAGFGDAEFADYAHLNRCGARRWTGLVATQLTGTGAE